MKCTTVYSILIALSMAYLPFLLASNNNENGVTVPNKRIALLVPNGFCKKCEHIEKLLKETLKAPHSLTCLSANNEQARKASIDHILLGTYSAAICLGSVTAQELSTRAQLQKFSLPIVNVLENDSGNDAVDKLAQILAGK